MLVIDKKQSTARLVVNVSQRTKQADPVYSLHLILPYSKGSFYYSLPSNTSPYPNRFDEFIFPTSDFEDVECGRCTYQIVEATDGVVQQGVLQLICSDQKPISQDYVYAPAIQGSYVVYKS